MSQGTILVVDDEPGIVAYFKDLLESEGYTVDTAYNGEEAWEKYQGRFYDVIIADWKMEKMDGMQLLQKIDELHPFAKVIMITAFGDEGSAIEAHRHHAFDYIKKPVHMNDLLRRVAEAVRRKDGVIAALEGWVADHPEESSRPLKATLSPAKEQVWSAKDVLEEIKGNTEQGRKEYQKLVQLTIDLLNRGRIK